MIDYMFFVNFSVWICSFLRPGVYFWVDLNTCLISLLLLWIGEMGGSYFNVGIEYAGVARKESLGILKFSQAEHLDV